MKNWDGPHKAEFYPARLADAFYRGRGGATVRKLRRVDLGTGEEPSDSIKASAERAMEKPLAAPVGSGTGKLHPEGVREAAGRRKPLPLGGAGDR